jgi:hypothetical protein
MEKYIININFYIKSEQDKELLIKAIKDSIKDFTLNPSIAADKVEKTSCRKCKCDTFFDESNACSGAYVDEDDISAAIIEIGLEDDVRSKKIYGQLCDTTIDRYCKDCLMKYDRDHDSARHNICEDCYEVLDSIRYFEYEDET